MTGRKIRPPKKKGKVPIHIIRKVIHQIRITNLLVDLLFHSKDQEKYGSLEVSKLLYKAYEVIKAKC